MGRFKISKISMPRINPLELAKQGFLIAVGSVFFGFGLSCFLVPFKIAPGGVGDPVEDGGKLFDTNPSIDLEDLISKFAFGKV